MSSQPQLALRGGIQAVAGGHFGVLCVHWAHCWRNCANVRNRVVSEQCFGRGKVIGPIRQVMVQGLDKVDALPLALADFVPDVPRGGAIDRTAAVARDVLRDVRRDLEATAERSPPASPS